MGLRTWMLRRFMGRLRIDDDTISYLSTFQRLGETVEVQLPGELLPVGARTVFRALRTRAAALVTFLIIGDHPATAESETAARSPRGTRRCGRTTPSLPPRRRRGPPR